MESGTINTKTPPAILPSVSTYTGTLSPSNMYGSFKGATAYEDLRRRNNTQVATFTYAGAEGDGGVAVGVRWSHNARQGVFAFIDTSSTPLIKLYEMAGAWATGSPVTSSALTLTNSNSYTLKIVDDDTDITASIVDDVGLQTAVLSSPTVPASNTEAMFGWIGGDSSHTFTAIITQEANSVLEPPTITPPAGAYANVQNVAITTPTAGASIYYTTNGSTPTTASSLYSSPIPVTVSETVKAFATLDGAADSTVASAAYTIATWTMEFGTIDGVNSGPVTLTGNDRGMLSSSAVYAGTWCAATAYQDLGTSNNTVSATFTYQGPEGDGGVAVGLRWDDSAQEGDFAFIDTSATPPVIQLYETTSGWSTGSSTTSSSLTLTPGTAYTLTITDDGSTVTAYLTDDAGLQSCFFTPTVSSANTEAMVGWVGLTADYTFASPIVDVTTQIAATPTFSPGTGNYTSTQSVTLTSATSGAAIYYTTDGSTPTTSSTPYTGAISVSMPQAIKAIAVLAGYTDSAVGSATYTMQWIILAGEIDGNVSGNFSLTGSDTGIASSFVVYTPTPSSYYTATAYFDTGSTGNSPAVTFVWDAADASNGAGPMIGTRPAIVVGSFVSTPAT